MNDAEVKLLLEAAKMARIDPSKLSVRNPFELKGDTAVAIQSAVSLINPAQAARWNSEAGFKESLQTVAVKAGLAQPTPHSHEEQLISDPDYVTGQEEAKSAWEAKMLKSFDEDADKLKASRERQFKGYQNVGRTHNPRTGMAN